MPQSSVKFDIWFHASSMMSLNERSFTILRYLG